MVFPNASGDANTDTIQGVILAEVACTFFFYILLKIIHYLRWGYEDDIAPKQDAPKEQSEPDQRKWDQKGWNIYFPIIFGNHLISLALPIVYLPEIVSAIFSFVHFGLFVGLLIINIFIKDLQPGKGSRTTVSRILWGLMCLMNIILILCGLAGAGNILV